MFFNQTYYYWRTYEGKGCKRHSSNSLWCIVACSLFSVLNIYVIPWARDYISDHYAVTYLYGWGHTEFSLIEGVFCILFGIADLVMRYFVGMFDPPFFWVLGINLDYNTRVERKAFLKSTIYLLTSLSLITAGIILVGFSIYQVESTRVW